MPRLLIVHHSPSEATQRILEAVLAGATDPLIEGVDVRAVPALDATAEDVLSADGYVLGSTANFGYISGALKHFFDTTYDVTHEATTKRPFSYWIHGGYDTIGAERAMDSITTGYGWRMATPPLVFTGKVKERYLNAAVELGATLASGLMTG